MSILTKILKFVTDIFGMCQQILDLLNQILTVGNANSKKLDQILTILTEGVPDHFEVTITLPDGTTQTFGDHFMASIRDDQQIPITVKVLDAKGFPATLDGPLVWTSSDETVATVSATSPDGLAALAVGVAPGSCRIVGTGDADLGTGVKPITATGDLTVTGGGAATIEITFGTPEDQGPPPPPPPPPVG